MGKVKVLFQARIKMNLFYFSILLLLALDVNGNPKPNPKAEPKSKPNPNPKADPDCFGHMIIPFLGRPKPRFSYGGYGSYIGYGSYGGMEDQCCCGRLCLAMCSC